MGGGTGKDLVGPRTRLLTIASGVLASLTSLLYLAVAVLPTHYFRGYVVGYYSLIRYSLIYNYDSYVISLPHVDYTRHISIAFAVVSLAMLVLSAASTTLVVLGRRVLGPAGVIYGVSSGLVVSLGLLYGYLYRAMDLDLSKFSTLVTNGKPLILKTNAGTIVYEGITVELTPVYTYILRNGLLVVLVTASMFLAGLSLSIAILTHPHEVKTGPTRGFLARARCASAVTTAATLTLFSIASVFTYYPASIAVEPAPPPVTLHGALYPYTCTALTRTARGALTYTDFERYPVPGWTSYGGTWTVVERGGHRGNALRGSDTGGGLGGAPTYYYNTPLNYPSLWIAAKLRHEGGVSMYYGIAMMNSERNRMYTVEIYHTGPTTGSLDIWSYNVEGGWNRYTRVSITGYSVQWYTLVVQYVDTGRGIEIYAWLYREDGTLVTSASASSTHGRRFRPAYLGVSVDGLTAIALFDDFIISTTDPRYLSFSGFRSGMVVEVWGNLGDLVNSMTAPGATFNLSVVRDVVAGTGADGRFVVKYPDAFGCLTYSVPTADAVLGGDSYSLAVRDIVYSFDPSRTSAVVRVYVSSSSHYVVTTRALRIGAERALYVRLVTESSSLSPHLYARIRIRGAADSTYIEISGGVVTTPSTNFVALNVGMVNHVEISAYYTAAAQSSTIRLGLEITTDPATRPVVTTYPITLEILN